MIDTMSLATFVVVFIALVTTLDVLTGSVSLLPTDGQVSGLEVVKSLQYSASEYI